MIRRKGPDRRRAQRRKLRSPASIAVGNGAPLYPCVISDISETGAKLANVAAETVPDEFDLLLAGATGPRRRSSVVWRAGSTLGVRFILSAQSRSRP